MRLFAWMMGAATAAVVASAGVAQERAMIVLDGSGSMWGQIEGTAKIEIARETLGDVLGAVPGDNELGLIVYGHRRKGDCSDIELAVPAAKGTGGAIAAFARGISPKGKTPLSAAVKQAAEALKFTEDKATVILVTDGLETCEMDPCALGRELESLGVDFTAHVVGFGLSKEEGAQVACLAEETGGQYLEASSAEALGAALTQTVVAEAAPEPTPEPEPEPEPAKPEFNLRATASLTDEGPALEAGNIRWDIYARNVPGIEAGERVDGRYGAGFETSAPAGEYRLVTRLDAVTVEQGIVLRDDSESVFNVVLDAGYLTLAGRRSEGGEIDKGIRVDAHGRGADGKEVSRGAYGTDGFYFPAGAARITARQGKALAEREIELAAGESREIDMIVGSGVVVATALYAEGGLEVESGQIRFDVQEAKADLKGKRENIAGVYGGGDSRPMDVPAGEAVLRARLGQAIVLSAPFAVKAGERTEVQVILDAGVAAIRAPGMYRIDVLGKKDIQGKRKRLDGTYGEAFSVTLPAGTYAVTAVDEQREVEKVAEFTVVAGERVEVTVE